MGFFKASFLIALSVWFFSSYARSFFKGPDKSEGDRLEVNLAFATSSFVTFFIWTTLPSAVLVFQTTAPATTGHMILLVGISMLSIGAVLSHRALTFSLYRLEKLKSPISRRWAMLTFTLFLTLLGLAIYGIGARDISLTESEIRLIRRSVIGSGMSLIMPWAALLLTCLWWSSRAYYFAPFEKLDNDQRRMRHWQSINGEPISEYRTNLTVNRFSLSIALLISPLLAGLSVNVSSVGRIILCIAFLIIAGLALWGNIISLPSQLSENSEKFSEIEKRFNKITDWLAVFCLFSFVLMLVLTGTK